MQRATNETALESLKDQRLQFRDNKIKIIYLTYTGRVKAFYKNKGLKEPGFKPANRLTAIEKNQLLACHKKTEEHSKNLNEFFDVVIDAYWRVYEMYPSINQFNTKIALNAWKEHTAFHSDGQIVKKKENPVDLAVVLKQYGLGEINRRQAEGLIEGMGLDPDDHLPRRTP